MKATSPQIWRPILLIVAVIVVDLLVVLFGHLSEREHSKMIEEAEARERSNRPGPHLYTAQIGGAGDVCQSNIALGVILFTTLGIFVAGKQRKNALVRSILVRTACGLIIIEALLLLTTAVTFVELEDWGGKVADWPGWLINSINAGWFYFVLIRLTSVFLAVLAVVLLWRWSRAVGATTGALLILGLTIFCVMTSRSPAGIYAYIDEIERWPPGEDYYFFFSAGKSGMVNKEDGVVIWGQYEKTADGWILTEGNDRYKLKSSWFGIWKINAEFPKNRSLLGRRMVPFLLPDGWPQWLQ